MPQNIEGPNGRLFAETAPSPDETSFQIDNTSDEYYSSPYFKQHAKDVQQIPDPTNPHAPLNINLGDYLDPDLIAAIQKAKQITFHATGDTGAAKVNRQQTMARAIANEASVADAMAADVQRGGGDAPAFFYHLGDVVYQFGEAKYYYDQFYEPYREYDRPIFAIPGNHDGMVFGPTSTSPSNVSLFAFKRNFCATAVGPSPDTGGLIRSAMTQPAVYFTLDAPFVSIIGLYSNVLDGPGVISSQGGKYPIRDVQLDFLKQELIRLKPLRAKRERAVVLAVHHPPLSADAKHGGSRGVADDIDTVCQDKDVNFWPDAVLSGHAHLYQRFTRKADGGQQIPYVVCGAGGYAATPPRGELGKAPITVGNHTLEIDPLVMFGYLTLVVDSGSLRIGFNSPVAGRVVEMDHVTVDLASGQISENGTRRVATQGPPRPPKPRKPQKPAPRHQKHGAHKK